MAKKSIKLEPKSRGLEEGEAPYTEPPYPVHVLDPKPAITPEPVQSSFEGIKKIVDAGSGYIDVLMVDGSKQRRSGGTISWRYNNPGNLKHGAFATNHGSVGKGDGGHAVFPNYEVGHNALAALLVSPSYNNLTISEMANKYAPADDGNDPDQYASFVSRRVGVHTEVKLSALSPRQKADLLEAVKVLEGYVVGEVG